MSIEGIVVGLLAIVVGAGWAFYGFKLFKILLPIWALFFGFVSGAELGQYIFGEGFLGTVTSWIIGGVFGVVLAVISYFWYYFAVSVAVGALGYTLGVGLMDAVGFDTEILGIAVGLIAFGVFAVGTVVLGVPALLIIIVSGVGGAAAMVNGVLILLGRIQLESLDRGLLSGLLADSFIGIVACVVVATAAMLYQLRGLDLGGAALSRSEYRY